MLIHVQPDKVSEYWGFFSEAILQSIPPVLRAQADTMASQMLYSALTERLQVWVYEDEDGKMVLTLTTCIMEDPVMQRQILLIYSMTSVRDVSISVWKDSLTTLKKFAAAQNISDVIAYSENEGVINLVKRLGGRTNLTLLEFSV